MPGNGPAGSYGGSVFNVARVGRNVASEAAPVRSSASRARGFAPPPATLLARLSGRSHADVPTARGDVSLGLRVHLPDW